MTPKANVLKAIKRKYIKRYGIGACVNCERTIFPHEGYSSTIYNNEKIFACTQCSNKAVKMKYCFWMEDKDGEFVETIDGELIANIYSFLDSKNSLIIRWEFWTEKLDSFEMGFADSIEEAKLLMESKLKQAGYILLDPKFKLLK